MQTNYKDMKVADIRKLLVETHGFTEEEVNEIKGKKQLVNTLMTKQLSIMDQQIKQQMHMPEDTSEVNEILDVVWAPSDESTVDAFDEELDFEPVEQEDKWDYAGERPDFGDVNWTDFILSQVPKQFFVKNMPTVTAFQWIVENFLGHKIKESHSHVVSAPDRNNDYSATVQHTMKIYLNNDPNDCEVYTACVDANNTNCPGVFGGQKVATASTRAKSRCLRDFLRLEAITADEVGQEEEEFVNEKVTEQQIQFLETIITKHNLDINIEEFIKSFDASYKTMHDVTRVAMRNMFQQLNEYQQDRESIPVEIRGFDKNWKTNFLKK